jgi:hypothetical protein
MEARAKPLVFHWNAGKPGRRKLGPFVAVALIAHLLVFYLIRVIDPVVERWTPQSSEIMLLAGRNELALPLLRELEDSTYHLYPSQAVGLSPDGVEPPATAFRPSFANYQINLRPLLDRERQQMLVRAGAAFERDDLLGLPERPTSREKPSAPPEASRTAFLNLGPELVWRRFEVDRDRLAAWFRSGQPLYFRVYAGVSPRGEVQVMSVSEEFEGQIMPEELELVRQSLRFGPAERWAWDWIEIQR